MAAAVEAELPTQLRPAGEGDAQTDVSGETEPMAPDPVAALARGAAIGRYVVLEAVGHGGMGIVYAAYDPELDRKIAIKILHARRDGSRGRARLLREAQSIARIAHPNVINVHDVGAIGESVFVAMEFVEGQTLTHWLREHKPSRERILAIFRQAGRGLAAAHAAGIVHRDFKPDNVLVGIDARARVVDFGLARGRATMPELSESGGHSSSGNLRAASHVDSQLTVAGTVMGTPAFMSPEQHIGTEAEAASDQFSFCVSLYQALYGERPFEGSTAKELAAATLRHRVRPPPSGSKVPPQLRRVLLRGLRPRPEERYPSMLALLRDLERAPTTRRRALMAGAALLAAAIAGVATYGAMHDEPSPCADADAEMNPVWNAARRDAAASAFAATNVDYAADAWQRTATRIDEYVAEWRAQQIDACMATRVHGTLSEALLDRRTMCLRRGLYQLDALIEVFERPDPTVVERAVALGHGLPALQVCADLEGLAAAVPPPDSTEIRAQVDQGDAALERATTVYNAGRYAEVIERLEPWIERAETLGYVPFTARLRHRLGAAYQALGESKGDELMRAGFLEGLESGDDQIAMMCALDIAQQLGDDDGRTAEALRLLEVADALMRRRPTAMGTTGQVAVASARAVIDMREGRTEQAGESFMRAVKLQEEADPRAPNYAVALQNLGIYYVETRRFALAEDYMTRARELAESIYGVGHPSLQSLYTSTGQMWIMQQRYEEAGVWLRKALAIQRRALGEDHPAVARTLHSLAIVARHLGDGAESERLHRQALAIRKTKLGADHPSVAESLRNLAITLWALERADEALPLAIEALDITRRRLPERHASLGDSHETLAAMLIEVGRADEALEHARTALDIAGDGARSIAALSILGNAQRALGEHAKAVATHERALARSQTDGTVVQVARARFDLAQSLAKIRADDPRVRELADLAQHELADQEGQPELRADLDAFLRERP